MNANRSRPRGAAGSSARSGYDGLRIRSVAWLIGLCALLLPVQPLGAQRAPEVGLLLIADESLLDPNFSRTVVLLLNASSEGASGVILNRTTGVRLSEVLKDPETLGAAREPLYRGGPVEPDLLLILGRCRDSGTSTDAEVEPARSPERQVVAGVCLVRTAEEVRRTFEGWSEEESSPLRVFSGYAGWGPGQLEDEIARGDWHLIPATLVDVFEADVAALWSRLIERARLPIA